MPPPRAVWLDRDGTLNVKAPEGRYVTTPAALKLLPGAGEAVARLNRAGVPVVVVTNQRGIALGHMTETDLTAIHARLKEVLARHGAHIDAILHCPHPTGACDCRKPAPGMLLRGASMLGIADLSTTVTIGDSESDVAAGLAAGSRTVRLGHAALASAAATCCPDLSAAVDQVLAW